MTAYKQGELFARTPTTPRSVPHEGSVFVTCSVHGVHHAHTVRCAHCTRDDDARAFFWLVWRADRMGLLR